MEYFCSKVFFVYCILCLFMRNEHLCKKSVNCNIILYNKFNIIYNRKIEESLLLESYAKILSNIHELIDKRTQDLLRKKEEIKKRDILINDFILKRGINHYKQMILIKIHLGSYHICLYKLNRIHE